MIVAEMAEMKHPRPKNCEVWTTFVPLYRHCLYLVLGSGPKSIVAARHEFNPVFTPLAFEWDGQGAMCSSNGCDIGLFFRKKGLSHGEIAHEILHATAWILDKRGLRFDAENLEGYTYLLEWITEWVYGHLGKHIR